jgi:hypothetical protein
MATAAPSPALAAQARRFYVELLLRELPRVVRAVVAGGRELMTEIGVPDQAARRRDLVLDLPRLAPRWQQTLVSGLRTAVQVGAATTPPPPRPNLPLALVDDDTIDLEIISSRMALAMMDKASWEFSDLRYRLSSLDRRDEMDQHDVLRPHVIARVAVEAWRSAGLTLEHWRTAQALLHEEFAGLIQEGYHETNRWLITQGVYPEVNLRPFIRRSRDTGVTPPSAAPGGAHPSGFGARSSFDTRASGFGPGQAGAPAGPATVPPPAPPAPPAPVAAPPGSVRPGPRYPTPGGLHRQTPPGMEGNPNQFAPTEISDLHQRPGAARSDAGPTRHSEADGFSTSSQMGVGGHTAHRAAVYEETRLITRAGAILRSAEHAEAVLGRLNRLVARQVPDFGGSTIVEPYQVSPGLKAAMTDAQSAVQQRFESGAAGGGAGGGSAAQQGAVSTPGLLRELQERKQALKQAATTPVERATIEIVALMFQSLLTEERIPAAVRVWFARLQMPVLRVAIAEPDFFATIDHPARKLIDRMGACVMGFQASGSAAATQPKGAAEESAPLEKEIKRVVQVVEAYPDTGRRVFQTVLTEFERFLENYFKTEHAAASKGVSLAQQIEQRETLAIQYTIELRKMLNEVPVHEGVREFLFHVWADVLATTAVKSGQASEPIKKMQRAAADLIWMASAKVSREERSEAIRRLPPLLKLLREGMGSASVPMEKQNEYIQALNNSLAAAFSARTATIPSERLDELMMQLETLEDLLPDVGNFEIDESMVRDLSGHESSGLEVVSEGGSMPTPAMIAWARDLQVGSWFKLDYSNSVEQVQLAWQGMRKQLSLFVTPQGRGIMFQQHRLTTFLQAGLLVPAEEESLTVRATRVALAKLDADPTRLLQ